jgi:hypothetical protein
MSDEVRVLQIQYNRVHFLLNRKQCSAGFFASRVSPLKSRLRYLNQLLETDEGRLLFFDLHRFWTDTFRIDCEEESQLAVIAHTDLYKEPTRDLLARKVFPRLHHLKIATDRLAFRISANTSMRTITPDQLKLHSPVVQQHMVNRGVLAVHPTPDSMGFFIDLEFLLCTKSLFAVSPRSGEHS